MSVAAGRLGPPSRARGRRIVGFAVGAGLALAVAVPAYLLTRQSSQAESTPAVAAEQTARPILDESAFGAATGVRVTQVAITGDGGIVDLRYQVLDPDRAGAVHSPETPPSLVDERTGLEVNQLVMGHSHKGNLNAGVSYYLLFFNPGNLVQPGDTVTVQLGEARLAHVRVR